MSLNTISIQGRFTKDPELKHTPSGTAVVSFSLAVDRDTIDKDTGARGVDFIDCVAWKGSAEFITRYFQKGQQAIVSGRLQIRDWADKDGSKHKTAEIIVRSAYFCGSKAESAAYDGGAGFSGGEPPAPSQSFDPVDDNDSTLPF